MPIPIQTTVPLPAVAAALPVAGHPLQHQRRPLQHQWVEVLREHGGVLIFCEIALYL